MLHWKLMLDYVKHKGYFLHNVKYRYTIETSKMRNAFKHYFNKSSFLFNMITYFERIIILFRMLINN